MTTKASHRSGWKANERAIAKYIGGKRVPITGRQRGDAPDIAHNWLAVEVKYREAVPGWIHEGMDQAEASRRGVQCPVLIIRQKRQPVGDAMICMRLSEFRERYL